jgi:hypothetical protein
MEYEVHITMDHVPDKLSTQVFLTSYNWSYSAIDGDPHLGPRVFHYATKHYDADVHDLRYVLQRTEDLIELLTKQKCSVVRHKVELVVFDSRKRKATL